MIEFLKLHFVPLVLTAILLFGCTDFERDNIFDPGSNWYIPAVVSSSSEILSSSSSKISSSSESETYLKCGDKNYDPLTQFCLGVTVYDKCNGTLEYAPTIQFCFADEVYNKCGGVWGYNPLTEQCCVSVKYTLSTQFCFTDNKVYDKCDGSAYDLSLQFCNKNKLLDKCDEKEYNPETQRCQDDVIETQCGTEDDYYNSETQFCSNGTIKFYDLLTDSRDDKTYKTVEIGTQTWMAENLKYNTNTSDSKCYGNLESNCDIYGRLYNWSAAGTVCPSGWNLPTDAQFTTLINYVERSEGCSNCAGKYLKSTSGWNSGGNGQDAYGFSALPSGAGIYKDIPPHTFGGIGYYSVWLSATGYNSLNAYGRVMEYNYDYAKRDYYGTWNWLSVRCVKD
ncbi:MAG: fibrobacter succinogenes major paralogous domain-containing protein [Fibromonadaceae bacterium]|nr:fibrobacter succinogenes major paralogous domain-containing protein [Fibromonadaceae bacterium]